MIGVCNSKSELSPLFEYRTFLVFGSPLQLLPLRIQPRPNLICHRQIRCLHRHLRIKNYLKHLKMAHIKAGYLVIKIYP